MAAERHTFKRRYLVCVACGTRSQPLLWEYSPKPPCPSCDAGPMLEEEPPWQGRSAAVHGDECDVTVRHGICHADGTPRRFRSKAEFHQACRETGWTFGGDIKESRPGETAKWFDQ